MNDNKKKRLQPRSVGRALAFQALYQEELNPLSNERNWQDLLSCYCNEVQLSLTDSARAAALDFAKLLFEGTVDRRLEIDRILNEALDKRTLKNTTIVDRNILRVAAYEMRFVKTAKAIVISEAIELGKRFGDQKSRAFLNGVLDQVDKIQLPRSSSFTVLSSKASDDESNAGSDVLSDE